MGVSLFLHGDGLIHNVQWFVDYYKLEVFFIIYKRKMRSSFVCVLSLLFVAAFAQQRTIYAICLTLDVIEKDTPISGSIEKKGSISYLLTNIMNWRVVSFAFQAKRYVFVRLII